MIHFSEWLQDRDPQLAESFLDRLRRIKDRAAALPSIVGNMATRAGGALAGAAAGTAVAPGVGTVLGGLTGLWAGNKAGKMLTSDDGAARAMRKT